jgi:hypothetical protein
VVIEGGENLSHYVFASTVWSKRFCKTCGVHIMNDLNTLTDEEVAALSEKDRQFRTARMGARPVTLRMLNDVDLGKIETKRLTKGKENPPLYINP